MAKFYNAFLKWRADAGMNNEIADDLVNLFHQIGLTDIRMSEQHEKAIKGNPDFLTRIQIWADVAASRGLQMVKDGFLTENERAQAEIDYRQWIKEKAISQELYLLAVEGTKQ